MNGPRRRARLTGLLLAAALLAGGGAYVLRARTLDRDIEQGRVAFERLCDTLVHSAGDTGSPGSVAHLVAAMQTGLARLEHRYPRWYESYTKDPARYPCGPTVPNTQVGSDR
jgi:hypothetical protein